MGRLLNTFVPILLALLFCTTRNHDVSQLSVPHLQCNLLDSFVWQMAAANVEAPAAVAAVEMPGGELSHEQVKLAVDGMIVEDLEHPIC